MTREDYSNLSDVLEGLFMQKDGMRILAETLIELGMEEEVRAHLGAHAYERTSTRRGYRAGYKPRTLKTRAGTLHFSVPQVKGCEPYHPHMYAHWQRSERALLTACAEMYFQGISTRRVSAVLQEMCGCEISSGTVSRIATELDERLAEFRARRFDAHPYPYLVVDARYEKVRRNGRIVSTAVLIVAGISATGYREILDWCSADSESEDTWRQIFRRIKGRGLQGVECIVSDAHEGIKSAIAREFQGVMWQRCTVHFIREALKKVSYPHQRELCHDLRYMLHAATEKECLLRCEEIAEKWDSAGHVRISAHIRSGACECLTVYSLPLAHRRRMRSTNMLERVMRELKRRSQVIGIFPNDASCDRVIGTRLVEIHESWHTEERHYINMNLKE